MEPLKKNFYDAPLELNKACHVFIRPVDRVLDIGCGIRPQAYFKPYLHVCLEPYQEYIDILNIRYAHNPGFLILTGLAQETLKAIPDESFDSVFLIDVIEHLEKEDGVQLLKEMERIARKQVILFTPLGFMPQHYEAGDTDAWGLSGTEYQEHKSGWEPEEFDSRWEFHICKEYHAPPENSGESKMYGAFWAVLNCEQFKGKKSLPQRTLFVSEEFSITDSQFSHDIRARMQDVRLQDFDFISLTADISPQSSALGRSRLLNSQHIPKAVQKIGFQLIKGYLFYNTIRIYKKKNGFHKVVYMGQNPQYKKFVEAVTHINRLQFDNGLDA